MREPTELDERAVAAAVIAHDNEENAQRSEPKAWTEIPTDDTSGEWAERLFCMEEGIRAYLAAIPQPQAGEAVALEKRPVAFRVKDFADGWILFHDEEKALVEADATGAIMQGLYVRDGSALSQPHPADERVVEALRAAYEKVKLWPENRMPGVDINELGDGFMDLLSLRNLIPDVLATLSAKEGR